MGMIAADILRGSASFQPPKSSNDVPERRAVAEWSGLATPYSEPFWYAAYTSANREKRVAEQLLVRSVEHFLPVYASVRRWKDRRVTLQMPLFPGYVFVRIALRDRLRVQEIPGVARLVGFNGLPAPLPEADIEALKAGLTGGVRAKPHPYLTAGRKVRVKSGPLAGMTGILLRRKNSTRFVISVELIMRSVAIEVDALELEPVDSYCLQFPAAQKSKGIAAS